MSSSVPNAASPEFATWAIMAGGGTAGHLVPGLATAAALVKLGHDPASIHFIGSDRGVEAEMIPAAGFSFDELPGRGIQRRLSFGNLAAAAGLIRGLVEGFGLVKRRRPSVIVVLGGHASLAPGIAAVLLRIPLVLVEQNARAGAVNRLLRRFAKASAVSFAGTDLPHAVVTGNPLRPELVAAAAKPDRSAACAELGLSPERMVVAVFSGSLGSRRINQAVSALVERWADREDVAIRHVVGRREFDSTDTPESLNNGAAIQYQRVEYEERIDLLLQAADVAVTRSGGTVAELAVFGVPALLVPLPIAPRDHQRANAQAMVDAGGAIMVLDHELDADRLERELEGLLSDPERRQSMAKSMSAAGHPDAADKVALLVEQVARRAK